MTRKEWFLKNTRIEIEMIAKRLESVSEELQEAYDARNIESVEGFLWGVKSSLEPLASKVYDLLITIGCEKRHNEPE